MICRRLKFTIIELLVSIAIIAILFSLLMPALSGSRDKARFARWLQFNKQCSNDPRCVVNLNFQDNDSDVLKNSALGYEEDGFTASDYDGIIRGNFEWGQGRWSKGKKAIVFDGMSTYVEFPKSKYVSFDGSSDFTIKAWVRFDFPSNSRANGIFSQCYMNSEDTGYSLYFVKTPPEANKKARIATANLATARLLFNNVAEANNKQYTNLDSDSWYQITLRNKVVDGNQELHLFINDTELKIRRTRLDATKIEKCSARLTLGSIRFQKLKKKVPTESGRMNYYLKGRMDEFMVYARALSNKEIKGHYLMGAVHGN